MGFYGIQPGSTRPNVDSQSIRERCNWGRNGAKIGEWFEL